MCSYCGCDSIEVIGRFMAEHVEIINATGKLRRAVTSGDPDSVTAARSVVAGMLWPHTEAEEAGLFRVMSRDEVFADHIATLCGEHRSLDGLLADVVPGDDATMALFEDALREHIHKEDNGLFPAAAVSLDGADWVEVHATTPHSHDGAQPHTHDGAEPHSHDGGEPHTHDGGEPHTHDGGEPHTHAHAHDVTPPAEPVSSR